ncbi:MAG: DUF3168 domain-containing protein [Alphaproteobacteria bacterium]|nr:DUF3168 domain-containing protein [Alphaproteobacteria bacterium]
MAGFSALAVQKALVAKLAGDATLMGLITAVYDFVPEDAVFPYLTLGDGVARDYAVKDAKGMEHLLDLHFWSRGRGRKALLDIAERVYALLHEGTMTVTGHALINMRVEAVETELMADGIVWHGRMRVRVVVM